MTGKQVGDQVMVMLPSLTEKLEDLWTGLYVNLVTALTE